MRNTVVEKSLDRKMKPRYLGPLIVLSRNKGGVYILCELDGSGLKNTVGVFRLIPYFPRKRIEFPDRVVDISTAQLRKMELRDIVGEEDKGNWMFRSDEEILEEGTWEDGEEEVEEHN
jgi:hypothetical protein